MCKVKCSKCDLEVETEILVTDLGNVAVCKECGTIVDMKYATGLRDKFKVSRPEGQEVKRKSFVLLYEADPAARVALRAYAMATKNGVLAQDLDGILNKIDRRPEDYPAMGSEATLNRGVTCKHFERGDTAVLVIEKKDIDE